MLSILFTNLKRFSSMVQLCQVPSSSDFKYISWGGGGGGASKLGPNKVKE